MDNIGKLWNMIPAKYRPVILIAGIVAFVALLLFGSKLGLTQSQVISAASTALSALPTATP